MVTSSLAILESRYRVLAQRIRDLRATRGDDSRSRARELSSLAQESSRVLSRAATLLPKRGADAEWVLLALRGELDRESGSFAIDVLMRRNQFPATYLEAFVAAGLARGEHGAAMIELAARWHGAIAVLDAMTRAADRGALSYRLRRFLTYYVRSPIREDRAAVQRAYDRLREATWNAPDAPPRARRARD